MNIALASGKAAIEPLPTEPPTTLNELECAEDCWMLLWHNPYSITALTDSSQPMRGPLNLQWWRIIKMTETEVWVIPEYRWEQIIGRRMPIWLHPCMWPMPGGQTEPLVLDRQGSTSPVERIARRNLRRQRQWAIATAVTAAIITAIWLLAR